MNCYEFELNVSNYIEGELKQKEIVKFKSHEKVCEKCCAKLNSMNMILTRLGKINIINSPNDFSRKLHNKITVLENRKESKTWKLIDIFDFGLNPKQSIAFCFSLMLIFFSLFYYIQVDKIPNINIADFKNIENGSSNSNPNQIPLKQQPSFANTYNDSLNNNNLNNKKNQNQNTQKIQVVNSKK